MSAVQHSKAGQGRLGEVRSGPSSMARQDSQAGQDGVA
jgi:hypothetical protein